MKKNIKKILRRLDYLAEVAFCILRNEKKTHVIHAAYHFSYAQLARSCWFAIILKVSTCFKGKVSWHVLFLAVEKQTHCFEIVFKLSVLKPNPK